MLLLAPTGTDDTAHESVSENELPQDLTPNKAVNKFRAACGAVQAILIRVSGPGIEEPPLFSFATPFVVIGRSKRADLRLNHPDVSLRHSYLQMVGGRLYCVDLLSRTGTAHERKATRGELVEDGESIRIGPYHLDIMDGSTWEEVDMMDVGSSTFPSELATDEMVRANVEVMNIKGKGRRFRPVEEPITLVGNAPGSHLRLKDNSISKTHCSLVRTADALWCVDLLGRGGTRLNGAEIRIGRLYDGDLLNVGKAKIRIHYSTRIDEPTDVEPMPPTIPLRDLPAVENTTDDQTTPADDPPHDADPAGSQPAMPADQALAQQLADQLPLSLPPLPVPAAVPQLPQATGGQSDAERNVSEAFVMSLVNQFGQMQQQMYQQSQQAMMMLVNMFSSLHQNHMDLIRDDLNRVQQITAELQSVQSQMLNAQGSATNVDFTREEAAATAEEGIQDAVISPPVPEKPAAAERPDKPQRPPQKPLAADAEETQPPGEMEPPQKRERADHAGVQTHALLSERLAELENERNSRWQKIMKTLTGIGGGGA